MDKPLVFIGSSSEGLPIAEAVFAHISHETQPKLWTHQLFLPGDYPMESLEKQLKVNDFAILVASPDDQLLKRGQSSTAMRDNLLLEFGLFAGALGRKRVFFLCPSTPSIELPSNLLGVVMATYDGTRVSSGADEIAAAVQVPCQQIRSVIRDQWESICDNRRQVTERIRASERGKAVESLYGAVVRFRDAVMVVQREAFAAVSDESAFNKTKRTAIAKIDEITSAFKADAELIGVVTEIEALARATTHAVDDLPFPRELSLGKEATRRNMKETGMGALNEFLHGGDPFRHIQNAASGEANQRIGALKEKYKDWWDRNYPNIEAATSQIQDKLFQSVLALAVERQTT